VSANARANDARAAVMIDYAFESAPEPGATTPVDEGVRWLRMPLPFSLSHINLWLLEDAPGPTIVDTGIAGKKTRGLWRTVLGESPSSANPSRVIVTHMHPDHVGSAGWLCEEFGIELWMTRSEYLMCRVLVADEGPPPSEATDFYNAAGYAPDQLARYAKRFGGFGHAVNPLPNSYHRLTHGQRVQIGDDNWQVICGFGHSPEHACLFSERRNILIAGDQLLPTISSNISVWPTEPDGNPLRDWLDSCRRLRDVLPADVLVLPAHGKPFRGAHERLTALIEEHETGLQSLRELCRTPKRAIDVFPALFKSRISDENLVMATGEAVAHLNYLIAARQVSAKTDAGGVRHYQTIRE